MRASSFRGLLTAAFSQMVHGGGGAGTRIVCGFLASEDFYNPLISTLPKALKIDVRRAASREWIEASVRFAANELAEGRVASSSVIARLSESLLTEAVRQYASTVAEEEVGWLKGVKDPHIGRALASIHYQLDASWSAEGLARGSRFRAAHLSNAFRRSSACRRSDTSRSGDCRARSSTCARRARRSRSSPIRSATNPRKRSAGRSSANLERRQVGGEKCMRRSDEWSVARPRRPQSGPPRGFLKVWKGRIAGGGRMAGTGGTAGVRARTCRCGIRPKQASMEGR